MTKSIPGPGTQAKEKEKDPALLGFIDSIEEGVARLIVRKDSGELGAHALPAALLPAGAREGQWIELRVRVVPPPPGLDPTELRRRLGQKDDGGDIVL